MAPAWPVLSRRPLVKTTPGCSRLSSYAAAFAVGARSSLSISSSITSPDFFSSSATLASSCIRRIHRPSGLLRPPRRSGGDLGREPSRDDHRLHDSVEYLLRLLPLLNFRRRPLKVCLDLRDLAGRD